MGCSSAEKAAMHRAPRSDAKHHTRRQVTNQAAGFSSAVEEGPCEWSDPQLQPACGDADVGLSSRVEQIGPIRTMEKAKIPNTRQQEKTVQETTMPRKKGSLTKEQIAKMQTRRKETAEQRGKALQQITDNPAFIEWKFWKKVPADLRDDVIGAIKRATLEEKKKCLSELEERAAAIREEIYGPDA